MSMATTELSSGACTHSFNSKHSVSMIPFKLHSFENRLKISHELLIHYTIDGMLIEY